MTPKNFKHNFLPKITLPTQTIDGKRHYILPDGTALKSVTSVLGEKLDKTGLDEWRERVGEEVAARVSHSAAFRGTEIHQIAEDYLLNKPIDYKAMFPLSKMSFKGIKEVLDAHVDNLRGVELTLYSKTLKAAGRSDLLAEYDGVMSIIDFKTSKKLKTEDWIEGYFIQSTAYAMMAELMYGVVIPQIVIIITVDHEALPQVFVKRRKDYIHRVLEVFTS